MTDIPVGPNQTIAISITRQSGSALSAPASVAPTVADSRPALQTNLAPAAKTEASITIQEDSRTADTIREHVNNLDRNLEFRVDDITGKTVVRVLDRQTNEVIRQIPNEELLSLAQRLRRGGGLLDDLTG